MGATLVHWVSGFDSQGNVVDIGAAQGDIDNPEGIINQLIEAGELVDNGFYFVDAPSGTENNFSLIHVNLTEPPEIKAVDRNDIFIGLSHD